MGGLRTERENTRKHTLIPQYIALDRLEFEERLMENGVEYAEHTTHEKWDFTTFELPLLVKRMEPDDEQKRKDMLEDYEHEWYTGDDEEMKEGIEDALKEYGLSRTARKYKASVHVCVNGTVLEWCSTKKFLEQKLDDAPCLKDRFPRCAVILDRSIQTEIYIHLRLVLH